jgi:hypothetical protein
MPIGPRIDLVNNADWRRVERKEQSIALERQMLVAS